MRSRYVGRTYRHDQKQYAAALSDGRVKITLLCAHLTNIVQFTIKSLCFVHISSRGGGWVVWARKKTLHLEKNVNF